MPTNKQRREAARRHLERQLQRRQEREAARRRFTLIASIVGTLVVIAAIVVAVELATSDNGTKKDKSQAGKSPSPTVSLPSSPTPTPSTSYPAAAGKSVTFDGVTVRGAADLAGYPTVSVATPPTPKTLEYKDLVVGTGTAAAQGDTVSVQYLGVLLKNGQTFDSSWSRGMPASFPLVSGPNGVIKGFDQGIGGTAKIPAMHLGGRRLLILPASYGYGSTAQGSIPANSSLIFVVDLLDATSPAAASSSASAGTG